ncbi:DUF551 domain-containing protein [Serratia bockelmannii]|uniref:DUF551 domain-containing protein n=1 Tax=Serratia bockelmannii TaxID=2703793 RepID=UPI00223F91F2|nr:DUF551 domain-containing protein [Serratia bockelmannii]MCW7609084.1 DUF551 domain-containing protein [Serratia bockelmannii]
MTLTTERLKELLEELKSWQYGYDPVDDKEQFDMLATAEWAVIELLANREAQPVAIVEPSDYVTAAQLVGEEPRSKAVRPLFEGALAIGMELYTAPPAPAVPGEMAGSLESIANKYQTTIEQAQFIVVGWNACRAAMLNHVDETNEKADAKCECSSIDYCENCLRAMLAQPVSGGYTFNSPEIPDGWISCSERMPEVGERDWRTALPVLVKCEIGVIPAYYGFTYHEGEQCFGFMESVKFGDASGSGPEQHENRLMMHVTHWMPLPAAPEGGNG